MPPVAPVTRMVLGTVCMASSLLALDSSGAPTTERAKQQSPAATINADTLCASARRSELPFPPRHRLMEGVPAHAIEIRRLPVDPFRTLEGIAGQVQSSRGSKWSGPPVEVGSSERLAVSFVA